MFHLTRDSVFDIRRNTCALEYVLCHFRFRFTRHTIEGETMYSPQFWFHPPFPVLPHPITCYSCGNAERTTPRSLFASRLSCITDRILSGNCLEQLPNAPFAQLKHEFRTPDTFAHKILNIISHNNFWFFNVEFLASCHDRHTPSTQMEICTRAHSFAGISMQRHNFRIVASDFIAPRSIHLITRNFRIEGRGCVLPFWVQFGGGTG